MREASDDRRLLRVLTGDGTATGGVRQPLARHTHALSKVRATAVPDAGASHGQHWCPADE